MGLDDPGIHYREFLVPPCYSYSSGFVLLCTLSLAGTPGKKKQELMDQEIWEFFSFLSGMGFWLILALILIGVFVYKKFRK